MHGTDLDLSGKDIGELTSPDAFTAFLTRLGYRTTARTHLTPESVGLAGESAAAFKKLELLSEDEEGSLRVVCAQPRSLTAKARNDLARVLGKSTIDHLLILAADYEDLEFVLLDKRKKEQQGPTGGERVQVVPKTINVTRRTPSRLHLRTLRRFTWTRQDGLDQFDKLSSVFGLADWIVVTNGRLWRLYGKHAHARATNFYEVDLPEARTASGDTAPNEAFRYFWLFFRPEAFKQRVEGAAKRCWLDDILVGCRGYAKRLGERLKERVFCTTFPHLAQGCLTDRKNRLGIKTEPTEQELADIFEATLTLLDRLLFLLYAESRDLLPIREAPYQAASLKCLKEEVEDKAGVAEAVSQFPEFDPYCQVVGPAGRDQARAHESRLPTLGLRLLPDHGDRLTGGDVEAGQQVRGFGPVTLLSTRLAVSSYGPINFIEVG